MALTGFPNFQLGVTSNWKGTAHVWRTASSHSGSNFTTLPNVLSFLNSYWNVIQQFMSQIHSNDYVLHWQYYDGHTPASLFEKTYASKASAAADGFVNTLMGDALVDPDHITSGLETCCLLQAQVGNSSSGKPVYMRKFIHGTCGSYDGTDNIPLAGAAPGIAAGLGNGSMFGTRVLVSPKGAQPAAGWTISPYFSNHQMPRRRKKAASSSLLSSAERAALAAAGDALAALVG